MRVEDYIRRVCEKYGRKLPTWIITVEENDPYLARHYVFARDWIADGYKRLAKVKELPTDVAKFVDHIWSAFLHEFRRGDSDREYHNHPWEFSVSLILAGGYTEERLKLVDGKYQVVTKTFRPGMINVIRNSDFHRVTLLDGKTAWTLFLAGRRTGEEWGFLDIDTGEYVPWKVHVQRRERSEASYSKSA